MAGGTEAFPDLGRHCQQSDCHHLDFLPFTCNACHKVFCLEHRSFKSHGCANSDQNSRRVVVCEICSTSIETTGKGECDEKKILEEHEKSGDCDPRKKKKKKPKCAVRRCREILTFSNAFECKTCRLKVCLRHRFPAEHACVRTAEEAVTVAGGRRWNDKFLVSLELRNGAECGKSERRAESTRSSSYVEAC